MNRKAIIIIVLQAFIIVLLFWFLVFYGKDEYEAATSEGEEGIESKLQLVTHNADDQGPATLILSIASQQQSGIQTAKLTAIQHQSTTVSYGTVETIDNLLDLRARYIAAIADGNISRATMQSAQQNVNRLQQLNQDDKNVSDSVLQEAIGTLNKEQAKLLASNMLAKNIYDSIRQQWGKTLANWVIKTDANDELKALLDSREVLLKVTLPFNATPNKNSLLQITQVGDQTQLATARFISDAPQADSTVLGKTYYYLAPASNLRAGMRITARMNSKKQGSTGVIVPHQATVWFANQAWVYQKLDSEKPASNKFVRRLISTDVEIESAAISGWYNTSGLNAGDELVVNGAQLLLSEELKYQITNENDD